jgi:arylsulfatase A-like enzyme
MHVPLIYRLPGKVPAGVRSDLLLSNYDFLPTILDYLGLKDKTPTQPKLPGHSYAGVLRGQQPEWDDVVFFEFETIRAIRTGEWKLILRHPDGPHELYHLSADPGERKNLFDAPEHAAVQQGLKQRVENFFAQYVDPQYDVWRGGRSKANLISRRPVAKQ